MENIEKAMIKQLRQKDILFEEKSIDNFKTFSKDDDVTSSFIDDIYKLIGTTPISFNELYYYPSTNKVFWSGKIANGVEWSVELSSDGKGFYLSADSIKISFDENKSILKLHAYFDTSWITSIREAIKNKDLSKN